MLPCSKKNFFKVLFLHLEHVFEHKYARVGTDLF